MSNQKKVKLVPVKEEAVSKYFSEDCVRQTRAGAKRHATELKSSITTKIEKSDSSALDSLIKKSRNKKQKQCESDAPAQNSEASVVDKDCPVKEEPEDPATKTDTLVTGRKKRQKSGERYDVPRPKNQEEGQKHRKKKPAGGTTNEETEDEGTLLQSLTQEVPPGTSKDATIADIEDLGKWKPPHWREVLSHIREMRSAKDAPVDSMGCDQCAEDGAPDAIRRLHHLLSLMLSSQTKDQVTFAAMGRLRAISGGLSIDTLLDMPEEELGKLINPVGFWKSKAKYIKATCLVLKDQYDGDIPRTVEGLCSLPGVGPKMAHLCMQAAWDVVSGIGVDTHVHRISNRLGWVRKPTNTPEKTRNELESWLPKDLWREVNHLLVGFGQTICKPVQPNCGDCLANGLCPSAFKDKKRGGK